MKLNYYNRTFDVRLQVDKYVNNQNLAIVVFDKENDFYPFAYLTINTGISLPDNLAFVDVDDCKWAEEFIEKYKLGKSTGEFITFRNDDYPLSKSFDYPISSINYPLYEFDLDKLKKIEKRL